MEAMIEVGVMTAAAWPLLRLISIGPFRRGYPRVALGLAGLLIAYATAIACVAYFAPWLLRWLAVIAVCALILERWRARPDYGRRRRLPPGSLSLVPWRPWFDDMFYLRQALKFGPIFKVSLVFRPIVCIVGHELGLDLLRRHEDALRPPTVRFNRFIPRGFLRYMNPADHRIYRKLFEAAIVRDVVRDCESFIVQTVRQALRDGADACARRPKAGIAPDEILDGMLFAIFTRVFFGIAPSGPDYGRLRTLYDVLDLRKANLGSARRELKALDDIAGILVRHGGALSAAKAEYGATPGSFLAAMLIADPAALDDPTVVRNLIYLHFIGRNDVMGLSRWVLKMIADHPEWALRVRDESALDNWRGDGQAGALAERIVRETLRLEQSEYLYRRAQQDIDFAGYVIPRGWLIRICIREGHRSADSFRDPDRFDPDRFLGRPFRQSEYAPFGAFRHNCLGTFLTHTVGRILVSEIASGFDWRAVADGAREFGVAHWQPSPKFRIQLTDRT